MIKIYPSALEGEPVEVHEIKKSVTLAAWLSEKAPAFSMQRESHPISIIVNDRLIESALWDVFKISPDDDVKITVEPKGVGLIIVAVVSLVAIGVAVYAMRQAKKNKGPKDRARGSSLDGSDIQANIVRWGDPIPEIAGSPIAYPAFLAPQHKYYSQVSEKTTTEITEAFLCIGKGEYQVTINDVFVGGTPATLLGDAIDINFYAPGESIESDPAAEWWHTSEEVGFTTFGGTGLTLGTTTSIPTYWPAYPGGFPFTRYDDNILEAGHAVPDQWEANVKIKDFYIEHNVNFSSNWVQSPLLDNAGLIIGNSVYVDGVVYEVSNIIPAVGHSAGTLASITGNSAPSRLDFGTTPVTFFVTLGGIQYAVALATTAANLTALIASINGELSGTPLQATESAGKVKITQTGQANGATIAISGAYADVMGNVPSITQGSAAQDGIAAKYVLKSAVFSTESRITTADKYPCTYEIVNISPDRKRVEIRPYGVVGWAGMPLDVVLPVAIKLHADEYEIGWSGPFRATPKGLDCDRIEVDIFYPDGLISYSKKGDENYQTASGIIQYREVGESEWTTRAFSRSSMTPNQVGNTHVIDVSPGQYEVRVKANEEPDDSTRVSNKQQWAGLKARIVHEKTIYDGITTMTVKFQSGDRIGGGVEDRISVRARRRLPTIEDPEVMATTSDIAPFFVYLMGSVGYGRDLIDMEALEELHELWKARGERFDMAIAGDTTLKSVANDCLAAGFSELSLRDGLITPVRDGARYGLPTRILSPQEYVEPLTQVIQTPQPDEIDGVDVEYMEYHTGKLVTESYRLPGDKGHRVEKIKLNGVTGRTQAWRHAARRRREFAYQRMTFTGATELQAMNCNYMDYIGLQDGIPQYGQSCFVVAIDGNSIFVSEEVKQTQGQLLAAVRANDGTVSLPLPVVADGNKITFETLPGGIKTIDGNKDATVIYLGEYYKLSMPAIITEVKPNSNGKVSFTALGYDERVYLEDDSSPYDVHLTSKPYALKSDIDLMNAGADVEDIKHRLMPYWKDENNSTARVTGIAIRSLRKHLDPIDEESQATASIVSIEVIAKLRATIETNEASAIVSGITIFSGTPKKIEEYEAGAVVASVSIRNLAVKTTAETEKTENTASVVSIESKQVQRFSTITAPVESSEAGAVVASITVVEK